MGESKSIEEIRPAFVPGVVYPAVTSGALLAATFGGATYAGAPLAVAALGCLLWVLIVLQCHARFRKTRLRFEPGHLLFETGGLGTKSTTELSIQNVTHLGFHLPVVEAALFGAGTLRVESAGSGGAEVQISHVAEAEAAFDRITDAMVRGGVALEPEGALAEERPALFGVLLNTVGQLLALSLVLFAFLAGLGGSGLPILVTFAASLLGLAALAAFVGVRVYDAKRQRCTIYPTNITFYGGLPKRTTIIPMGNVADSRVIQTFIDRLLSLSTVKVSCQGAGNEISLECLPQGAAFSDRLSSHLREIKSTGAQAPKVARDPATAAAAAAAELPTLTRDREFTAQYQMTLLRNISWPLFGVAIFGILSIGAGAYAGTHPNIDAKAYEFLLWCPILAVVCSGHVIKRALEVFCTTFEIGADEITEQYKFLSTKTKRFSFDKVTSMTVTRGVFDWLLGTVQVQVFSIGSSEDICLRAIPWCPGIEDQILAKIGIHLDEPEISLVSELTPTALIQAQPGWFFLTLVWLGALMASAALKSPLPALAATGILVPLTAAILAYQVYYYRTCRLDFSAHSVLFQRGLFSHQRTHVTYDNVKELTAVRFPMGSTGTLRVNIAGEAMTEHQAAQVQANPGLKTMVVPASNSFTVPFVPDVMAETRFFDALQIQRPERERFHDFRAAAQCDEPAASAAHAAPSLPRKLMAPTILAATLLAPLAAMASFGAVPWFAFAGSLVPVLGALGLYTATVRTCVYRIETGAVVNTWGLFFDHRKSITFDQVDFISVAQGFVDQAFGTGRVQVHTTGSSRAEMVLAALPDHEAFGATLKKHAKGDGAVVVAEG